MTKHHPNPKNTPSVEPLADDVDVEVADALGLPNSEYRVPLICSVTAALVVLVLFLVDETIIRVFPAVAIVVRLL